MTTPSIRRWRFLPGAVAVALAIPLSAQAAPSPAVSGATWLSSHVLPSGLVAGAGGKGDLTATAQSAISLNAARVHGAVIAKMIAALRSNETAFRTGSGKNDPGALAYLVLALKDSTSKLSTNDLATAKALASTVRHGGNESGLFGTSDPTYDGSFRQGLALAALAGAGTKAQAVAPSISWLLSQRCPNGGFTTDVKSNACSGKPADYAGPDTNSTALAVIGLAAYGRAPSTSTLSFLHATENADGGWGFFPGNTSDPDSTALVISALASAKVSLSSFIVHGHSPLTVLASFQARSGVDAGGFTYPGNSHPDLLSTTEAVLAMSAKPTFLRTPVVVPLTQ